MKDLSLLVWLTQLGLSVALPFAGFILLALWLQNQFGWGDWTLWVGIVLGGISAFDGFRSSIKAMIRLSKGHKDSDPPSVSFNDHD
ncbi:MAG: AtpZ/AtpI family protein [Ruminococcaceae bacterium]|nr:AtpZ/AtpI family protein [Oscillospiraceae bacterium]